MRIKLLPVQKSPVSCSNLFDSGNMKAFRLSNAGLWWSECSLRSNLTTSGVTRSLGAVLWNAQGRDLSLYVRGFTSTEIISVCISNLKTTVGSNNYILSAVLITVELWCFLLRANSFLYRKLEEVVSFHFFIPFWNHCTALLNELFVFEIFLIIQLEAACSRIFNQTHKPECIASESPVSHE